MDDRASPPPSAHPEVVAARRDPRLDHGPQAVFADWWAALEAAERTRRLADWGLHELKQSLRREEQEQGVQWGAPMDDGTRRSLEAAWVRQQLAEAEAENQMAEMNAMALLSIVGALDALVETLAPSARQMRLELKAHDLIEETKKSLIDEHPGIATLAPETEAALREALADELDPQLPLVGQLGGRGATRWEAVLRGAGLEAPPDRQIPADMDEALNEVVALRHVIAHRASRVDARALRSAPTLRWTAGELVRLNRVDYRRYVAALRTYGDEVIRRVLGPPRDFDPPITEWRSNVLLNT